MGFVKFKSFILTKWYVNMEVVVSEAVPSGKFYIN